MKLSYQDPPVAKVVWQDKIWLSTQKKIAITQHKHHDPFQNFSTDLVYYLEWFRHLQNTFKFYGYIIIVIVANIYWMFIMCQILCIFYSFHLLQKWPYMVCNIPRQAHFYGKIYFVCLEKTVSIVPTEVSRVLFS